MYSALYSTVILTIFLITMKESRHYIFIYVSSHTLFNYILLNILLYEVIINILYEQYT